MRAIRVHEHGGPEILEVDDIKRPTPGPGEILIQVIAAGINPVDTYFRKGAYSPVELPFIPGVDYSGEVVEVHDSVTSFDLGDIVFGTGIGNAELHGAYAEYATVPVDRTVHLPDGVDPVQAGAAGVAAGTAWRALIDHGQLSVGDTCLIHGGSGGVGHAAVQLASIAGAEVLSTASENYHEKLVTYGADTVVSYDRPDLSKVITETVDDRGVDVILDHKLDQYFSLDADVAGVRGHIVAIGEDQPDVILDDATGARSRDLRVTLMSMFNTPDLRVPLRHIARLMETGELRIHIDHVYDLSDAQEAHESLFSSFLGKRAFVMDWSDADEHSQSR